jgi:hypothetical protein
MLMKRQLAGIYEHECKRLVKVSVLLGCGASLLRDWCQTFRESVLVSSSVVEMSLDISNVAVRKPKTSQTVCNLFNI